jgi:ligand-binding SRPBCC domain-containing protein
LTRTIVLRTEIEASREVVFDLSRSVALHVRSMDAYAEEVVEQPSHDLLGPGDEVTWRARHFGVLLEVRSRITAFDRPVSFRDSMVAGPFARFDHDHLFEVTDGRTRMTDRFDYVLPFGLVGRLADVLAVKRHLKRLVAARAQAVKREAERTACP